MSIALESNTSNRIERSGFGHRTSCIPIYDSTDSVMFPGDLRFPAGNTASNSVLKEPEDEADSCSSSSIGRNSDTTGGSSDGDGDSGEHEVQSSIKGPLDNLDALEEVLPMKRGISTFYNGKSKSFTSLADATSCSSIKDIAKPEDAYTRKRKNLLAHTNFWDKNRDPLRSNSGGISKRLNCRSTMALPVTMSSSDLNSSSPSLRLPPLPPHSRRPPINESLPSSVSPPLRNFSTWRSFSLSDLQQAAAITPAITESVINNGDKENDLR